jgi:hypothetical protein
MYLLDLNRDYLLIEDELWKRLTTFDAVSRNVLATVKARKLTQEQEDLLVELELFRVSDTLSALVDSVNKEIHQKLFDIFTKLGAAAKANATGLPQLLAKYRVLAERATDIARRAWQQKRNDELSAEAARIEAEMETIFAEIANIIKASYAAMRITITDEEILAMVNGSRDDLLAKYIEALK